MLATGFGSSGPGSRPLMTKICADLAVAERRRRREARAPHAGQRGHARVELRIERPRARLIDRPAARRATGSTRGPRARPPAGSRDRRTAARRGCAAAAPPRPAAPPTGRTAPPRTRPRAGGRPRCASPASRRCTTSCRSMRAPRRAGPTPKSTTVTTVTASVNSSTEVSSGTPWTCGSRSAASRPSTRELHAASASPRIDPPSASSRLSTNSWRAMRHGLAPRQARSAISRVRALARASSRLATLAQAIRSTVPTAPAGSAAGPRTSPTRVTGERLGDHDRLGILRLRVRARAAPCARARSRRSARPSRARPAPAWRRARGGRSRGSTSSRSTVGAVSSGIHTSARFGKSKSGGITPTIVAGPSAAWMVLPTISGSPP